MEMPLGIKSHFATLENGVSGRKLNMKGEIFRQQTRLVILGRGGRKISVHRAIFLLIKIVNLE